MTGQVLPSQDLASKIIIDQAFRERLSPLEPFSFQELEQSIIRYGGADDPLVVWDETDILVDGHHRYDVCLKHGLPFKIIRKSFASREAVERFIDGRQLGRRNLNENVKSYLIGKRYREEKREHGAPEGNQNASKQSGKEKPENLPLCSEKTAAKIAAEKGMSEKTVRNAANYAAAVDTLAEQGISKNAAFESSRATVKKAANLPEEQRRIVADLLHQEPKTKLNRAMGKARKVMETLAAHIADTTADLPNEPLTEEPPVVEIDGHLLLCGDNTDQAIRARLPAEVALAFCDPPYNSTDETWDGQHVWQQDYLAEIAAVVAVTPGISAIQDFMRQTAMPYKWSTACFIKNGMARGALGFGNWMYTAVFSAKPSIHRNRQDVEEIVIRNRDKHEDHSLGAKRQKPPEYLAWLLGLLANRGDVIIDAFAGSGTSVIVAHQLGMRCIAIEKDKDTYQAMVRRVRMFVANGNQVSN